MHPITTYPTKSVEFNPGAWAVHVHVWALRKCSDQIDNLALYAFRQISHPVIVCAQQARKISAIDYCYTAALRLVNGIYSKALGKELVVKSSLKTLVQQKRQISHSITACVQKVRKISAIDYCYTTALRLVNGIYSKALGKVLVDNHSLKTLVQQKRQRKILLHREKLGKETIYPQFCHTTAQYVNEVIPHIIGEELRILPGTTEAWLLYRMGLLIRYVNYQFKKHTGYREALIASETGKAFDAYFCALRTHLAHFFVGKDNLDPFIDFEHMLLKLSVKFLNRPLPGNQSQKSINAVFKTLAGTFSAQEQIDAYLKELNLQSPEDAFIARLEWHKTHDSLPEGVPDPHKVSLTAGNLYQKLDEALYKRLENIIEKLLNRFSPQFIKKET